MKKIKKLIEAFCDSPYIMQSNYEETLEELLKEMLWELSETDAPVEHVCVDLISDNGN